VGYLKYYKLLFLKGQQFGKGQKISLETQRRVKLEESAKFRLIVGIIGNNLKRRGSNVLNKICLGRGDRCSTLSVGIKIP